MKNNTKNVSSASNHDRLITDSSVDNTHSSGTDKVRLTSDRITQSEGADDTGELGLPPTITPEGALGSAHAIDRNATHELGSKVKRKTHHSAQQKTKSRQARS